MNVESFMKVLRMLHEHDVEYILVGGIAVILHGVTRATEDIDLFVKRDSKNLEKLRNALYAVFEDPGIEEITAKDLEEYSVVRYGSPEDFYIDIFDRIGEVFHYHDLQYEIDVSQGFPIRVATIETLIKLKKDTIRKIDQADVLLLREKLNREDE